MKSVLFLPILQQAASASLLSARQFTEGPDIGINGFSSIPGNGDATPAQQALFASAGRSSNTSTEASFPFSLDSPNENWTWRVNVTNVALPADLSPNGLENYSAAYLQWDLQWSGGRNLKEYLGPATGQDPTARASLCIKAQSYPVPSNVTSRYSADDNGNCSSVLGNECATAVADALGKQNSCSGLLAFAAGMAACQDSLGTGMSGGGGLQIELSNSTFGPSQDQSLQSGETIFSLTYKPLPASNLSNYEAALSRLNVLYIGATSQNSPTLLCQVVDLAATSGSSTTISSMAYVVVFSLAASIVIAL